MDYDTIRKGIRIRYLAPITGANKEAEMYRNDGRLSAWEVLLSSVIIFTVGFALGVGF